MGFYQDRILPYLLDRVMRAADLQAYRARLIPRADGLVVEIGFGSGLNLPFYPPQVTGVLGIDPSAALLARSARTQDRLAPFASTRVRGTAERLPVASASIDTVVCTWTLCSVGDVAQALAEVRRVLRPGGQLLFVEHGLAPDASVQRWQRRLTPCWRPIAGGCRLDRPVAALIERAGLRLEEMAAGYVAPLKPFTYMSCGRAVRDQ